MNEIVQFFDAAFMPFALLFALLAQYDLLDLVGENRLYPANRHGITAFRQEHGQPGPETDPALV